MPNYKTQLEPGITQFNYDVLRQETLERLPDACAVCPVGQEIVQRYVGEISSLDSTPRDPFSALTSFIARKITERKLGRDIERMATCSSDESVFNCNLK